MVCTKTLYNYVDLGLLPIKNIDLPENFNSPYKAHSIVEFWRRWHMTLTRFFTKYIYYPLGGSKKGLTLTCLNVMVVFLASGIWHGAAWTFVLWGALHGIMSVLSRLTERACKKARKALAKSEIPSSPDMTQDGNRSFLSFKKISKLVGVTVTFAFVALTWVLFRADSVTDALVFFERMFCDGTLTVRSDMTRAFATSELTLFLTTLLRFNPYTKFPPSLMLGFFAAALGIIFAAPKARSLGERFSPNLPRLFVMCVLFVWCLYSLSGVSTFLYFNF